ncbi:hypothetical protein NKH98_17660 [Mesorhizobium sp. M0833]|uniref:hypothetical protein n=1 Tax=Mesorhizobium sp. M0833 TaxID=2957009 RepID=UPI003338F2A9
MGETPNMVEMKAEARDKTVTQLRRNFLVRGPSVTEAAPDDGFQGAVSPDPMDRVAAAREAMRRIVRDRFGGDAAMMKAVDGVAITGEQAIAVLEDESATDFQSDDQGDALETIIAFDGSRPSFLVRDGTIDFASSYNTENWAARLKPHAERISAVIDCVGRVEIDEDLVGTAFLATPTLAITNRHVADILARFENGKIRTRPNAFVDFGREAKDNASRDRREIKGVIFAGSQPIIGPIEHSKFDLAVLYLSESKLVGNEARRCLDLGGVSPDDFAFAGAIATIGYPTDPSGAVPTQLRTEYADVLVKLLEGDGGAKRFAPGLPASGDGLAAWTASHDATTLKGNSGAPLLVIGKHPSTPTTAAGLHYGGRWNGPRTNWAHLLALTSGAVGYCGKSFGEFCSQEGIRLVL